MKCHTCHETGVELKESTIRMEVRGVPVEFKAEVEICGKCGQYSIPGRVANEFGRRLDLAYRKAAGLLTIKQLVESRKRLGFNNQKGFADYLGVGEASVKRWEAGALLDRSSSELIRLKSDLAYARRNVEKICALNEREVLTQPTTEFNAHSSGLNTKSFVRAKRAGILASGRTRPEATPVTKNPLLKRDPRRLRKV